MAKFMIRSDTTSNSSDFEFRLSDTQAVFYLTGDTEQPFAADANQLAINYGYIFRHGGHYILYINDNVFINGQIRSISYHPLLDGDQITVNSGCRMTFYLDPV